MKYIFDFDDVLFDTEKFKEHIFNFLEKVGVNKLKVKTYYRKDRESKSPFSLKKFLLDICAAEGIKRDQQEMYEDIMRTCQIFINGDLRELITRLGKENCFLVTDGLEEFQKDKIKHSAVHRLFNQIYIVQGSKKGPVEYVCGKYTDEPVIFFDNKKEYFNDLDKEKFPNLKTVEVPKGEKGFERIWAEVNKDLLPPSELKRRK